MPLETFLQLFEAKSIFNDISLPRLVKIEIITIQNISESQKKKKKKKKKLFPSIVKSSVSD